jgi:adenine-specific DNA-methyltransferase
VGYALGVLYTSILPVGTRAALGAYYTPPAVVERLLDSVENSGVDLTRSAVLDPACGGAAFLAATAQRIRARANPSTGKTKRGYLKCISENLRGFEIDPFAAWMSQVLVEMELMDLSVETGLRVGTLVTVCDSLRLPLTAPGRFDVVLGNPPYGRVRLCEELRRRYAESLYGHANLYGLFTELALRWANPSGVIAYVTPTSFLAGQYFKSLRRMLADKARPTIIDFVSDRTGVFEDVLQETLLVVFDKRATGRSRIKVSELVLNGNVKPLELNRLGTFRLPADPETPWVFPRTAEQAPYLRKVSELRHRLVHYGYEVNTGQLVWNRHKPQLRCEGGAHTAPIIWAESVTGGGTFRYRASRRNHLPYLELLPRQEHLLTRNECVLVQRTTAKEQKRRLLAAVMPADFIGMHPRGVVVENHLNIVRPTVRERAVPSSAVAALLNSRTLDLIFRCISGSVAVSAYELNSLPLPDPENLGPLLELLGRGADRHTIDRCVAALYDICA